MKGQFVDIKLESLEDNTAKITVTVDAKTVDAKLKKTYKDFATRYNFPGFRKGKAPRPVIDNALGREAILASVTEDVINDTYPDVIEEEKLYPAGSPDFGDADNMVEGGRDFTFTFTLALKPTFELDSYEPVQVEVPKGGATDAEVDEQLKQVLQHYKDYKDAPANTKFTGERVAVIDIVAKGPDGEEVAMLTKPDFTMHTDTEMFPKGFKEQIEGIKKGENRTFSLDIADDDTSVYGSVVAGQKIDFDVTCKVVQNIVEPELTDEFVKETFQMDSADALKEEIRQSITDQKEEVIPRIKENSAADIISKRLVGDVPDNVVEQIESELLQDFFTQLQARGITFDTYLSNLGIDNNQFKEDVKKQAQDQAKQELALDAWAAHYNIGTTDDEVAEEFIRAGVPDPQGLMADWKRQGRLYLIREGVVRAKAMDDILEKAIVVEVDPATKVEENNSESKKDSE